MTTIFFPWFAKSKLFFSPYINVHSDINYPLSPLLECEVLDCMIQATIHKFLLTNLLITIIGHGNYFSVIRGYINLLGCNACTSIDECDRNQMGKYVWCFAYASCFHWSAQMCMCAHSMSNLYICSIPVAFGHRRCCPC